MGEGVHTLSKKQKSERNIDEGLNKAEIFTLRQIESRIRRNKTESAWFVDENGLIVGKATNGTETYVMIPRDELKPNTVMVHNHPGSTLSDNMAGRIGKTFSTTDINLAINGNLKEIRAVTPTYTYSLKRPKSGWGDKAKIKDAFVDLESNRMYQKQNYVRNRQDKQYIDRADVVIRYQELRKVAKKFGWKLTRKKTA